MEDSQFYKRIKKFYDARLKAESILQHIQQVFLLIEIRKNICGAFALFNVEDKCPNKNKQKSNFNSDRIVP